MEKVISYNFDQIQQENTDWDFFYKKTRRDANFACVFKTRDGSYLAIRDHLGTIPLYYRIDSGKVSWSFNFNDLLKKADVLSPEAVRRFLGIPTAKTANLIPEIKLVPPGTVLKVIGSNVTEIYKYKILSDTISFSHQEIKNELRKLIDQAVDRTIKSDSVGLYLSGGMDSGLLGQILKRKGVNIKAYTALPWGRSETEYEYAKKNSGLLNCEEHTYSDVLPSEYPTYLSALPDLYKTPHGTGTSLNIASLWLNTKIKDEKQIFFAQNTDTLTSSVPSQINSLVMQYVPKIFRDLFVEMPHSTLIKNYLHHSSRGAVTQHDYEEFITYSDKVSKIAQAGMYIVHTQSDSEAINGPSISSGQLCSNPYYDMDLIEFYLSIHWKHKIAFNKNQKTFISFEKRLFREIACESLPRDLVYRKKGFILPKKRNQDAESFFKSLPESYLSVNPSSHYEKVSLAILKNNMEAIQKTKPFSK